MNNDLLLSTLRRLLTEIVRLRFKDQYARHRQMQVGLADHDIRTKLTDIEALAVPLLGPQDTEQVILEALREAREHRTQP
ncbi:hypothetical protein [Deinococcus cellulosilyticus]|uniref:Uncharacterized protein n=1 Tax=Deinococcus cellulosilyticus (strain DSM 18568 / NBRC 106333 / KACC 11606 / 5516J-15) TaxID=1223518 RepID=A0A511NAU0_DEIC1|nr:hypothetical protein [Deinococcus cellulosilyticus]GEM49902.1 hypothetical protein DC3_55370 [Deinococcus cellulosilyticus NBRC 106333 = KACC 11606]